MKNQVGNTTLTTLPRTIRIQNDGGYIEVFKCPDGTIEVSAVDQNGDALDAILGKPGIKVTKTATGSGCQFLTAK